MGDLYQNNVGWTIILCPEHNLEGFITFHAYPVGNMCRLLPHEFHATFKCVDNLNLIAKVKHHASSSRN